MSSMFERAQRRAEGVLKTGATPVADHHLSLHTARRQQNTKRACALSKYCIALYLSAGCPQV